jgi:hypothetical protein
VWLVAECVSAVSGVCRLIVILALLSTHALQGTANNIVAAPPGQGGGGRGALRQPGAQLPHGTTPHIDVSDSNAAHSLVQQARALVLLVTECIPAVRQVRI